jgi:hypothetical protein
MSDSGVASASFTITDGTPPVISGVAVSGLTSSGAVVSWTTNENSDSQVEYGGSTSYGQFSPLNATMVTQHSVTLTGLSPNTTYQCRVRSKDGAGNLAMSGNISFITPAVVVPPPPPGSGLPTLGLKLWLAADQGVVLNGSGVAQWQDQSGSAVHAAQATAASRPVLTANAVNGKPAVRFDGANDFLTFQLALNGLNGMTIFLVSSPEGAADGGSKGVLNAPIFWNETASWGTVHLSPFSDVIKLRFGTGQSGNLVEYRRPASAANTFSLVTAMKSSQYEALYVNGQQVLTLSGKLQKIANTSGTGNLGRGYNNNTYFQGDIAEVIVYTGALTGADRRQVEQYLQAKYNLP